MPQIQELGQKVKRKYPGIYDDLSDLELGRKIKKKYPTAYSDFTEVKTPVEPKKSLGRKAFDFLTSSEQGTAKAVVAPVETFSSEEAVRMSQSAEQLINQARRLPETDPRRRDLLLEANKIAQTSSGQAEERFLDIPSTKQAAMDIGFTGADILGGGTFGKATKTMKTGQLFKAAPTVLTATEKIGEKVTSRQLSKKAAQAVTRSADELTPTQYKKALGKGLVQPRGVFKKAVVKLTEFEKKAAEQFKPYLRSANPVENVNSLVTGIGHKSRVVGDHLKSKKIIYNTGELRNRLLKSLEDVTDITLPSEQVLQRAKMGLVDDFVKRLDKNDLYSLWRARSEFDAFAKAKLKAFGGTPTLRKEIAETMRNAANEFITDRLGSGVYGDAMKEISSMYRLIDIIGQKATKERGLNAIGVWARNNPTTAKVLGFGVGAGASYFGLQKIFGGSGQ